MGARELKVKYLACLKLVPDFEFIMFPQIKQVIKNSTYFSILSLSFLKIRLHLRKDWNTKYSTTILVTMCYTVPARRHIPEDSRRNSVSLRIQTSYSVDSRLAESCLAYFLTKINRIASDGVLNITVSKISVSSPKHGSSRGVSRPGREAYHSLPSSAEVKNEWRYISATPIRPQGAEGDNFTFAL